MLLVVLVGCSGGRPGATPSATVGTAAPQTTTTNPYTIPAVIDAGYVSRVLAGLDAEKGDITRLVVKSRTVPPEAFDRLKAMYATDDEVNLQLRLYSQDLADGLSGYLPNPGNKRSTVMEVISANQECVYVRVQRDYSAVGVGGSTARTEWIAMQPVDPSRDPHAFNGTGWSYLYEGYTSDRSQPAHNPCAA